MKKPIVFFIAFLTTISAFAQGEQVSSGLMRSELKIYVVVVVLLIIFSGIILFLINMEKRLKKLEANQT